MTDNYAFPQFPENLDKSEDLNKNLIQFSLTLAENNAEYSRKINQELVEGFGKMVSEVNNPEQFSQAMVNLVSTAGETTTNYFMNSAELIQKAQKETLDIFLGKSDVEVAPEVLEVENAAPKKSTGKVKVSKEVPVA